ncbi:MAG TPA: murein biosynthesis integral membrane protein MurJ [Myxococcota bacterium]|nr:murein biosynthesis integral membrane protein MurJ [Myxococcota bacterium]
MGARDLRKNSLVVGAANVLARITGLLREMVFAAVFGASPAADAYTAAFRIGNIFRELFAEGALSNAFVPLFAEVDEREGPASARALANAFLGVLLVVVGIACLLTFFLAEPLVHLMAGGFADVPGKVELTAKLTRILSPFVLTVSVASVFMGMLNVRGRFFLPAITPLFFNIAIIATCLLSTPFAEATGHEPIVLVALGALAGGAAQALCQLPMLRGTGFRIALSFARHPALGQLLKFIVPAVLAIAVTQLHLLIEMQLASREGDGPVSWLLYAFRIAHLPFSIVSGAVAVAGLAGLSVHAAKEDWSAFRDTLAKAMNDNVFLILPSAVGLFLLAEPLTSLFYERHAFGPEDTTITAALLQMYAIGLIGIGGHRILVPVFYTLKDPWTPMFVGIGLVLLKLPLALWLMGHIELRGLPLSHAILATVEVIVLLVLLERRVPGTLKRMVGRHARVAAATLVMGVVVWLLTPYATRLTVAPIALGGALVYFLAADLVGLREGRALVGRLRRQRGLPPTIDEGTQNALFEIATRPTASPRLEEGVLYVDHAGGSWAFGVLGETLVASSGEPRPAADLAQRRVRVTLRVGGGPPRLVGLSVDDSHWRVEGDAVAPGQATGVLLDPVTGAPG